MLYTVCILSSGDMLQLYCVIVCTLSRGNSILEQLKCQNFKYIFPSTIMHICKEDTLKCSGNNFPKVYSVVSRKGRLLIFDQ